MEAFSPEIRYCIPVNIWFKSKKSEIQFEKKFVYAGNYRALAAEDWCTKTIGLGASCRTRYGNRIAIITFSAAEGAREHRLLHSTVRLSTFRYNSLWFVYCLHETPTSIRILYTTHFCASQIWSGSSAYGPIGLLKIRDLFLGRSHGSAARDVSSATWQQKLWERNSFHLNWWRAIGLWIVRRQNEF